jgi:TolB-like protein
MPDIFLSYTREDQATAQRFAEAFQAQGFTVWWDATLRSGEAYDQVTEEALHGAKAVVVLWSPRSVASRWVRAEATVADQNRTLTPVMIEACRRPVMFELTQTADLCRWTGDVKDPAWRAFLADVRRFVDKGAAPNSPVQPPATQGVPTPPSARPSIAVLPFINRSGVEADDVFADCMVEDLTAALSVNRKMKVIAAGATAPYRKGATDLRRIGRDLGVRYLLEGNVRRVGEDLRVTAQLVDAADGDILWMQKFDRPLSELSALQEDLVTEVAAHLGVQVLRAEIEHALKKPGNLSAWEAALRASAYSSYATRAGREAAVVEARRAVEIDPNDALAHAHLAATLGALLIYRGGHDPELAQEVLDSVRRGLALDPNEPLVPAFGAFGLACLRKPLDALPLAERAVAINPNDDAVRFVLGSVLVRLGRSEAALAEFDVVERLAPNSNSTSFSSLWGSIAHLQSGRIELALETADRALRLLPGAESLIHSVLCLAKSNLWDRARHALRRLRDMDPELSCAQIENLVGDFYGGSDAVDEYVGIVRKVWDDASSEACSP